MNNFTRFRAYQLGTKGSLCSYSVDSYFTLIEGRINEKVCPSLFYELDKSKCKTIGTLHITSWDSDHCNADELSIILDCLSPRRIEYPGYDPDSDNGKNSQMTIINYLRNINNTGTCISPNFVIGLTPATQTMRNDVIYNPRKTWNNHNDNSVVKLFRFGRFSVLSLGDCESVDIARNIMSCSIAKNEVDVLILSHHGANNGFTTREFLKAINPSVAICTSDRGNMYGHPEDSVRKMLSDCNIPLFTTKDGDVLVTCGDDNICQAYNMVGNNDRIINRVTFRPKIFL